MQELSRYLEKKKIDPKNLSTLVLELRAQGKTIATLNGSFDLFHSGHLHILFEAKKQADILIVALNSDSSIKGYKSPERPIITLQERIKLLGSLEFVDFVTWFDELDPCKILEIIRPDVHVNGVEYGENCIESLVVKKYGGRLHLVSRIEGLSTSQIINKIKELKNP